MTQIRGFWWPDDVGEKWKHSLRHVRSLDWALGRCVRRRTAIQAGGNIGLWPRTMAASFGRVITFEPDAESRSCLCRNVPENVEVRQEALGATPGLCGIRHRSLGSHQVVVEDGSIPVTTVDALGVTDCDLLQLDVEGYEWHALTGARETLRASRPVVQVELRGFTEKYGHSDADVRVLLSELGYQEVSRQPGHDVVFA